MIVQPEILVGLPSQLLERRPDILQAEATLVAATAPIGKARVYFFSSLSITGQGGLQSVEFANWFAGNSTNYSIGASVTLPIFLGGTNVARLDTAEARYQQMLESYHQTILLAFREVADLLTSIQARGEQLARQREQVAAATAAVGLADVRYRKGLANYLDVFDAQRTMLGAETQLAQTERASSTWSASTKPSEVDGLLNRTVPSRLARGQPHFRQLCHLQNPSRACAESPNDQPASRCLKRLRHRLSS